MDDKTRLITQLRQHAIDAGIALISSNQSSTMVPIASEPYSLEHSVYNVLAEQAELLGRFTIDAALDSNLIESTANHVISDKVCETLWNIVTKKKCILGSNYTTALRASTAIIQRTDFYIVNQIPRLIEINATSVALLNMSAQLANIQAAHGHRGVVQSNLVALFSSLAQIAVESSNTPSVWVMLVSEEEPMINDQVGISHGYTSYCKSHNISSIMLRRTCKELIETVSIQERNLMLSHSGTSLRIVGVYWRTGYAREHCTPDYERLRILLETHSLVSIPTAEAQLAGLKVVQNMIPTLMSTSRYTYLTGVAPALSKVLDTPQAISDWLSSSPDTSKMILKTMAEGGGNCVFGDDIPAVWTNLLHTNPKAVTTYFLMERLVPDRQGPVQFIYPTNSVKVEEVDAEISIYSFCLPYQSGGSLVTHLGALVRMKSPGTGEGGILHGQGVLSCLKVH